MHCISISHKVAPTHIRQLFAFSEEEQLEFEKIILEVQQIQGCVIVSTCNRSEIYFSSDKNSITIVENEVAKFKKIDQSEIRKYLHIYSNEGALKHLFQVTCGLDSMVLGEDEILRQVKDAYQLSLQNKYTCNELNIAFQNAISNAKLIKTETKLSNTPVSIGTLTSNRILEFLKTVKGSNVLIVGATGKIGSIIAKNLCSKGKFCGCKSDLSISKSDLSISKSDLSISNSDLSISNSDLSSSHSDLSNSNSDLYDISNDLYNISSLNVIGTSRHHYKSGDIFANCGNMKMIEYKHRYQYLKMADVIVSATTSPHYTFTCQEVAKELKGSSYHKLFIDLAVPCDIDKDILAMEGMELIDIDYFENASKRNNTIKQNELDKAEQILNTCIDETLKNMYFQEFYGNMNNIVKKIEEKGFPFILYRLKETLSSEQWKALLDSLQDMIGENE